MPEYERMILSGRPFLCAIPQVSVNAGANDSITPLTPEEERQELARASDHGLELLKEMQGQCIYYGAGWWVYSFCYNVGVRQFHPLPPGGAVPRFPPMEDQSVASFVLGRVDHEGAQSQKESGSDVELTPQLQTQGETNYLVQRLGGGSTCDLTGRARRIDVQFHCNAASTDRISMIKETASCVYLMIVHTPRLCSDVVFQPPQVEQPHTIACREIVADDQVVQWKAMKKAEAESKFFAASPQAAADMPRHPNIGGVELGAQKLVGGAPERSIKVSNIVAAAQKAAQLVAQGMAKQESKYVATFAKSDGTYTTVMSEAEMKRNGFTGSKEDIDKWIADMNDMAGPGIPWRLDVLETAQGLEFQGIFGKDDDETVVEDHPDANYDGGQEYDSDEEDGSEEEYKQT